MGGGVTDGEKVCLMAGRIPKSAMAKIQAGWGGKPGDRTATSKTERTKHL